jgi:hypothetical protein
MCRGGLPCHLEGLPLREEEDCVRLSYHVGGDGD